MFQPIYEIFFKIIWLKIFMELANN